MDLRNFTIEDVAAASGITPLTQGAGETSTDQYRRILEQQPDRGEFTLTRAGLELLVSDSERYGERNKSHLQLCEALSDALDALALATPSPAVAANFNKKQRAIERGRAVLAAARGESR